MMKLLFLRVLLLLYIAPFGRIEGTVDKIADLIRQGKTSELSQLFASNIDLNIMGEENSYSKAQAEIVLNEFFSQYQPKSVKPLHNINSNPNYRFSVLILQTSNGIFRIAYTLKGENGSMVIIEIRIEAEKVK